MQQTIQTGGCCREEGVILERWRLESPALTGYQVEINSTPEYQYERHSDGDAMENPVGHIAKFTSISGTNTDEEADRSQGDCHGRGDPNLCENVGE